MKALVLAAMVLLLADGAAGASRERSSIAMMFGDGRPIFYKVEIYAARNGRPRGKPLFVGRSNAQYLAWDQARGGRSYFVRFSDGETGEFLAEGVQVVPEPEYGSGIIISMETLPR